MEVVRWLSEHAESLLASVGIVGGLIFNGVGLHRDSKARRIENMISLTQQHRDLWRLAADDRELSYVRDPRRNVSKKPPTERERLFMQSVIVYLGTVYKAIQLDELLRPRGMERDIREFFAKPVPRAIWNDLREFQDPDFVAFVEEQLK